MASRPLSSRLASLVRHQLQAPTTSTRRPLSSSIIQARPLVRPFSQAPRRLAHQIPKPPSPPSPSPSASAAAPNKTSSGANNGEVTAANLGRLQSQPHYRLAFTCLPCSTRSTHNVSKQGYHHGSVLITCPSCRNRHVISDHLRIFGDRDVTVEDLMREKGRLVKKGTLGVDEDIEFWPDEREAGSEAAAAEPAAIEAEKRDPPKEP
jgi:mitochondrial protein import protein ZIM17